MEIKKVIKPIIALISVMMSAICMAFTVEVNALGIRILRAEDGMAIRRKGQDGPSSITVIYLAKGESIDNFEDCPYAKPEDLANKK